MVEYVLLFASAKEESSSFPEAKVPSQLRLDQLIIRKPALAATRSNYPHRSRLALAPLTPTVAIDSNLTACPEGCSLIGAQVIQSYSDREHVDHLASSADRRHHTTGFRNTARLHDQITGAH